MSVMSPESSAGNQDTLRMVIRIVGGAAIPHTRESLSAVVEEPLLAACEDLYDKNIRTVVSSANLNDVNQGFAYINIDCNTLSDENRRIAETIGMETFTVPLADGSVLEVGSLKFPVSLDTTIEELSQSALEAAKQFKEQPMLWAPVYILSDLRALLPGRDDADIIAGLVADGYFYDKEEQRIYISKEHYLKTKGLSQK